MWSEQPNPHSNAKGVGIGLLLGLIFMALVYVFPLVSQEVTATQASTSSGADREVQPIQAGEPEPRRSSEEEPGPLAAGVLDGLDEELEALAERAHESVVMITSHKELSLPFRQAVPPGYPSSVAIPVTYSGVIINEDGFVLTLADAVERSKRFQLHLPDGREVPAKRWAVDARSNLGVLRIQGADSYDLAPAAVADSNAVRRGQFVMTCGNPFGLQGSTSTGHITGTNRALRVDGHDHFGILQIDATVNPGDPGGAAFNARGELIGIIWATYGHGGVAGMPGEDGAPEGFGGLEGLDGIDGLEGMDLGELIERLLSGLEGGEEASEERPEPLTPDDLEQLWQQWVNQIYHAWAQRRSQQAFLNAYGINFVMPVNSAMAIAEELIEHREVRRARLGLQVRERTSGGLLVEEVVAQGPAAEAGLLRGDEIVSINGHSLSRLAEMQRHLVGAVPGQTLEMTVRRDGETVVHTVTLESAKK